MAVVLGVDAAWTPSAPSGVALLSGAGERWECVAVAPSYEAYMSLARGANFDWHGAKLKGSAPNMRALLQASRDLAGQDVSFVAIDMPVSTIAFSSRRQADHAISVTFGSAWCAAHSPTASRPREISATVVRQLGDEGYPLITVHDGPLPQRGTIEVYPHPALLVLLGVTRRFPYKVQRSTRLWPQRSAHERASILLEQFAVIRGRLEREIDGIPAFLPPGGETRSLSELKRYEDALDALVCGWVAIEALAGRAEPYGDSTAAIWVPSTSAPALAPVRT